MRKIYFLLSFLLLCNALIAKNAPQHITSTHDYQRCATHTHMQDMMANNPEYAAAVRDMQSTLRNADTSPTDLRAGEVYTIPVVVHVLYSNDSENVSDDDIYLMLDRLNADYRLQNADAADIPDAFASLAADVELEFCLATRDPSGAPTNGIVRKSTTTTSFNTSDAMKSDGSGGSTAWDVTQYFNIWICPLVSGLLGYAEFPTFAVSNTYGVAITTCTVNNTCPPYNLGRTLTHEVGHCLSLFHIWGDDGDACTGSDDVFDTPNQAGESFGCPSFPATDACATTAPGIMFMNYMDYSNDACTYMFTNGQANRARTALTTYYPSLLTSPACAPLFTNDVGITSLNNELGIVCEQFVAPELIVYNYGTIDINSFTINYQVNDNPFQFYDWTGTLAPSSSTIVTLPPIGVSGGVYEMLFATAIPNFSFDEYLENDSAFVTINVATSGGLSLPIFEGFEDDFSPGWIVDNPDGYFTWKVVDWAASEGNNSVYIDNYNYTTNGEQDGLLFPTIDLSNALDATLTFDRAYALYSATDYSDTLRVQVSTDCGTTWNTVYEKYDDALTTVTSTVTDAFIPTLSEWEQDVVDLSGFAGTDGVLVRFLHTTDYENNLYIDNIAVTGTVIIGTEEINDISEAVQVYPNPASDYLQLYLRESVMKDAQYSLYNALGELVQHQTIQQSQERINIATLSKGLYFIHVETARGTSVQKVIIQ